MSIVERNTGETRIRVSIESSGGESVVDTSIPFLDHMIRTLARYSGLTIGVSARGDLRHHISEDVAISLGAALSAFVLPACARFGDRTVPMDDALVHVSVDLGGRSYYEGPLPSATYEHWMRSFAENARATLHVRVLRGRDRHHIVEASFKALGLALRHAVATVEANGVFSTKGAVAMRVET